jgi:cation diffusion facilitator family transporter
MPRITKTGALKVSLVSIVTVIVIEGLAGLYVGSLALQSDAAHAAFDAFSTLILLISARISLKPADEDHTYGHGKIEAIGSLMGGVILLVLAAVIIGEAALRISSGVNIVHPGLLGYAAATYTIAIDFLRMGILNAALTQTSLSVKAGLYDAISDFAATILAFVGLASASFGYPIGDTAASIIVASLLGYLSIKLIHSTSMDLSDAVSGKLVQSILAEIRKTDEVLKCKELRVRHVGDVTFVDAVIGVSPHVGLIDADTIAARIEAGLQKLLGKSSIMIHIEPWEWEIPVEMQVRLATSKVEGARGMHNLSVTTVDDGQYVTLHVQVDPSLPLDKAHEIAEGVERGIQKVIPQVRRVTVHIEPSRPERSQGTMFEDKSVSDAVRSIIESHRLVAETSSIVLYSTGDQLRIDINCLFKGEENIARIHDAITKMEEDIKAQFSNAIVTIHAEPARRLEQVPKRTD